MARPTHAEQRQDQRKLLIEQLGSDLGNAVVQLANEAAIEIDGVRPHALRRLDRPRRVRELPDVRVARDGALIADLIVHLRGDLLELAEQREHECEQPRRLRVLQRVLPGDGPPELRRRDSPQWPSRAALASLIP